VVFSDRNIQWKHRKFQQKKLLGIIEEKDRKIAELEKQLEWLMSQIRLAKHKQFGTSSEKTDSLQLSLFNEAESHADMTIPAVIKGGFAAPETIAHIAVQKFMMASPLYRQEQEWKQNGILLSRQTMSNWLIKASEAWLEPIYEELKRRLCKHEVLHADETTIQVLKEPGKAAQSKSYMWLYRTSGEAKQQIVLYDYQPDRKPIHPQTFLKDFKGYLHADGYSGYHKLPEKIIVVGCWSHLRRKFFDALKTLPKDKQADSNAARGVSYCDRLFYFEKQFALLTPENRLKERERLSRPLIDEFYNWIEHLNALPNTLLGKAAYYAQSQRKYLERYLLDGRLEISNNRAERSIKPFVNGQVFWRNFGH
jgi:transposase